VEVGSVSRLPYLEPSGNLVVPFDAPIECQWWKAATGGRYAHSHPENMPDVELVEDAFELARVVAAAAEERR
jgi:hypothetical protein